MAIIRTGVKHCLVATAYYTGVLALMKAVLRTAPAERPLILMYHRVLENIARDNRYVQDGIAVSGEAFDKQMRYLAANYRPVTLQALVASLQGGPPLPKKAVAVTFDDGWRDNYTSAYPILKKYEIPATIFLTTDFIDSSDPFWFVEASLLWEEGKFTTEQLSDILSPLQKNENPPPSLKALDLNKIKFLTEDCDAFLEVLKECDYETIGSILKRMAAAGGIDTKGYTKERRMLSWEEINDMAPELIDFGSHGLTHRIMTTASPETVREELSQSKTVIEEKTGRRVDFFAYPNGNYDDTVKNLVRETGYRAAIATSRPEKHEAFDLYALKRIGLHEGVSAGMTGRFSPALFYFALSGLLNIL